MNSSGLDRICICYSVHIPNYELEAVQVFVGVFVIKYSGLSLRKSQGGGGFACCVHPEFMHKVFLFIIILAQIAHGLLHTLTSKKVFEH